MAGNLDAALRAGCAVERIHAIRWCTIDMPRRRAAPGQSPRCTSPSARPRRCSRATPCALAFELRLPRAPAFPSARKASLCRELAQAAGHAGMAGGQAIDLAAVGKSLTEDELRQMHRLKTGALLQASVTMGAACGETSAQARRGLESYGRALGLAFQVVDDIVDVTADSATLGKTPGKDALHDKPTYVSLLG